MQDYGGISRYFVNLISGIKKSEDFSAKLPLIYSTNYYLRGFPQALNNIIGKVLLKKQSKRNKWNRLLAKQQLKNSDYDLFHATYHNPYFLDIVKMPLVITIHDMIYENYPHLFEESCEVIKQKERVMEAANTIIAISNYTREQIINHYPHLQSKIKVIYHGLPKETITAAKENLPKKFILYVGDRYALYKNFIPFLKAVAPVLKEKDIQLICAGGGVFTSNELLELQHHNILNISNQTNATDAQLKQLYQEALAFIYPSLEEGFGLPMLEAFRNSCPIACSNTSCLPEVGGIAASYFDPLSADAIRTTISELVSDPGLREKLIKEGHKQINLFTFDNCLNQTLDCYRSILSKLPFLP